MAKYTVNDRAVEYALELIAKRQYVLDSNWGESSRARRTRTPTSSRTPGRTTPPGTSG